MLSSANQLSRCTSSLANAEVPTSSLRRSDSREKSELDAKLVALLKESGKEGTVPVLVDANLA